MADMEKHVTRGDPKRIPADTWNGLLDVLAWFRRHKGTIGANGYTDLIESHHEAFVRNDSVNDLTRSFRVLNLFAPLFALENNTFHNTSRHSFKGDTPASSLDFIGIVQSPLATTKIGRAVFRGLTLARVRINSELHSWCVPVAGEYEFLDSADSGVARIIYTWEESAGSGSEGSVEGSTSSGPPVMMALIDLIQSSPADASAEASLSVANLTESEEPSSGDGRVLDSGDWVDNGITYSDSIYSVEVSSTPFALSPDATVVLFDSGGQTAGIPLQYADKIGSTYYGGLVSTDVQQWQGYKHFADQIFAHGSPYGLITDNLLGSNGGCVINDSTTNPTTTVSFTVSSSFGSAILIGRSVKVASYDGVTATPFGASLSMASNVSLAPVGVLLETQNGTGSAAFTSSVRFAAKSGSFYSYGGIEAFSTFVCGSTAVIGSSATVGTFVLAGGYVRSSNGTTYVNSQWNAPDSDVTGSYTYPCVNFRNDSAISDGGGDTKVASIGMSRDKWLRVTKTGSMRGSIAAWQFGICYSSGSNTTTPDDIIPGVGDGTPGATSELKPGNVFQGGICTNLGTGSYASVPSGALTGTYNTAGTY